MEARDHPAPVPLTTIPETIATRPAEVTGYAPSGTMGEADRGGRDLAALVDRHLDGPRRRLGFPEASSSLLETFRETLGWSATSIPSVPCTSGASRSARGSRASTRR